MHVVIVSFFMLLSLFLVLLLLFAFRFLVQYGCDVNAQDSDGWTPLHCAGNNNINNGIKLLEKKIDQFLFLFYFCNSIMQ